jgi:hypothetical protein
VIPAGRAHPVAAGTLAGCVVGIGTALAVAGTVHAAVNARALRRPPAEPSPVEGWVSVLLPLRDEADRVEGCLRALLDQRGVPDLEILVLDDGSTDGTAAIVRAVAGADPRVRLITGVGLPPGWLGKPHACQQLADAANQRSDVLVFVDADVVCQRHAIAATVGLLLESGLDLVSPYPRQQAGTLAERLVQPLLQWSWLTTLPLRIAERSGRPSLSAANGQLLAVQRAAYREAGGHASVRDRVIEDVELLKAVKRVGGRGGVVDGTSLATCRMYRSWPELADGYTKSLWAAFGSPAGALGVSGALAVAYVVPAIAALAGSPVGLAGYLAGVAGRVVTGRRTGATVWPDAFAQPVSIALFGGLAVGSLIRRRRGRLSWKGRSLSAARGNGDHAVRGDR